MSNNDDELEPASSAEECYLEVIEMLLDAVKVTKTMHETEIAGIIADLRERLTQAGQPESVRRLELLTKQLLNR